MEMEEEEEEEEEEPIKEPEMLVPNRSRRANAGQKMQELIRQQLAEGGDNDNFYSNIYGGFKEVEQDDDFISPLHTSDEEQANDDEVDSDFDRPEEEEDNEEEEQRANRIVEEAERAERRRKRQKQKQLYESNKNWAIARINKASVPENSCDPKTQRERLEEAKKTAKLNIASLKRFEQFELERKKRQAKSGPKFKLEGPRIKEIMTSDGKHLLLLPDLSPKEQLFPRPDRREFRVCAVTGKHARYIDPLTKLPYADAAAFRIIRDKYKQFLREEREMEESNGDDQLSEISNGKMPTTSLMDVDSRLQPPPAKQRKVMILQK